MLGRQAHPLSGACVTRILSADVGSLGGVGAPPVCDGYLSRCVRVRVEEQSSPSVGLGMLAGSFSGTAKRRAVYARAASGRARMFSCGGRYPPAGQWISQECRVPADELATSQGAVVGAGTEQAFPRGARAGAC